MYHIVLFSCISVVAAVVQPSIVKPIAPGFNAAARPLAPALRNVGMSQFSGVYDIFQRESFV